jgi:RecA-family ATPase
MLPLSKAGLVVADGGIGKTRALLDLAVCVVTGRRWLGHFDVAYEARSGRVLLGLAEEDREEVWRRLYDLAQAYQLTREERAKIVDRVVILALSGKPVSLLSYDRDERELVASAELRMLRKKLAEEAGGGWSLIALDPLSRWGSEDTETDNAVATRTMQAAESLLDVPGAPTLLFAHHASSDGLRAPQKGIARSVQGRGVTGIRNAARWQSYLVEDGAEIYFRQNKSNYSRPMREELRLVRCDGGLLRVETPEEEQDREARSSERKIDKKQAREADRDAAIADRNATLRHRLLAALHKHAGIDGVKGRGALCALAEVRASEGHALIAAMVTSGEIVDAPVGGRPRFFPRHE